jgi:hypothetical protein
MYESFKRKEGSSLLQTQKIRDEILARIKTDPAEAMNALGTENDGDEIISGQVVLHLKHCEIRNETLNYGEIYMPCTQFKKNFYWMESLFDGSCLAGFDLTAETSAIKSHLWMRGPTLVTMQRIMDSRTVHHADVKGLFDTKSGMVSSCYKLHHMGLGAAFHMSATAEPVLYWLKRGGVVEQQFVGAISRQMIEAGRNILTLTIMSKFTMKQSEFLSEIRLKIVP